jgi:inorganic pyrophosphatase
VGSRPAGDQAQPLPVLLGRLSHRHGFITHTLGEGGEALDALVLTGAPTFPGCMVEVRTVAVLRMDDEEGNADKLVCVPVDDPAWDEVEGVDGLPGQLRTEIEHFYSMYKQPEGKDVDVHGWEDREVALKALDAGLRRYGEENS